MTAKGVGAWDSLIWVDPPISLVVLAGLVAGYALWQFFKQLM